MPVVLLALVVPGWLAGEVRAFVLVGVALALLGAFAGNVLLSTQATLPASHPQVGPRFVMAVSGNFMLHAVLVAGGMVTLRLRGSAGEAIAGFGLAYATAAALLVVIGAVVLAAALRARAAAPMSSPSGQEFAR